MSDPPRARPLVSGSQAAPDEWDTHWQALGTAAADNPANHYRHGLILHRFGALRPGDRLLDIGSGQGEFAVLAATRYPELRVRGIEFSDIGVERARQRAADSAAAATFSQRDLLTETELEPGERAWANLAVCSEVLEHVDEPATLLRNALPYLEPGCKVIITVPGGPRSAFDHHIGHRCHFDARRLWRLLADVGLQDIRIDRGGFPFFNLYRMVVMLRGRALIADVVRSGNPYLDSAPTGRLQRRAVKTFDFLFRWNLDDAPFGWQLVATAFVKPQV